LRYPTSSSMGGILYEITCSLARSLHRATLGGQERVREKWKNEEGRGSGRYDYKRGRVLLFPDLPDF